jgi:hypothetical protein
MPAQTLRELAREYAKGTLDRESYRRQRSALIDGILAGTVAVPSIDYAPPVGAPANLDTTHPGRRRRKAAAEAEIDDMDFFDITQVVTPADDAQPLRSPPSPVQESQPSPVASAAPAVAHHRALIVALVVAILAVLGLGVALLTGSGDPPAPDAAATAPAATPAVSAALPEAAPAVPEALPPGSQVTNSATDAIVEFLKTRNWSEEGMDQFAALWVALPQAERDAAAGSGEMLQMANAIYRKLLELRALSQVTDPDALAAKHNRLLEFARTLGIDDPRLSAPPAGTTPANP